MRRSLGVMGLEDAPATVHDLRRTFASGLGELGISRLVVGKLLNHTETGVTGRHYDKFAYGPEKTAAMGAWSDRLTEIVTGRKAPKNVVELKRSA